MRCGHRRQRGVSLVETALLLPILIGLTFLAADLFRVNMVRGQMEQAIDTLSSVLAGQQTLSEGGLQQLLDVSMQHFPDYQLNLAEVQSDRTVVWWLQRGNETHLCDDRISASQYNGELPQDDEGATKVPLIVVQGCIPARHLGLASRLLMKSRLQTVAMSRQLLDGLQLDEALAKEAGLDTDE